ncbi:flagellar biosynthesis anti-sigma factor FlgM [Tumebacillus algifaecis]|uniref:Negative regulator of flagellin synthesis n=1 Tax=Tumebacillus algifaecis TaxID=1214604 RepID=A0A223CX56_9BACL|nr:flagellar biosynthesis anti-sigma factor FlgM [Tumebacillus algifaecis]ASS73930.1 flagellar biosynthesis anti-sigma factor FlgM [Tumebacillus algifaecis]
MKINDTAHIFRLQAYQSAERAREEKGVGQASGARDGVSISSEALEMSREEDSALRSERFEAVKESVQNGTYQVDLQKVAAKLYESFMR